MTSLALQLLIRLDLYTAFLSLMWIYQTSFRSSNARDALLIRLVDRCFRVITFGSIYGMVQSGYGIKTLSTVYPLQMIGNNLHTITWNWGILLAKASTLNINFISFAMRWSIPQSPLLLILQASLLISWL